MREKIRILYGKILEMNDLFKIIHEFIQYKENKKTSMQDNEFSFPLSIAERIQHIIDAMCIETSNMYFSQEEPAETEAETVIEPEYPEPAEVSDHDGKVSDGIDNFNEINEFNDIDETNWQNTDTDTPEPQDREFIFLEGYIRPFLYEINGYECTFKDMIGNAFSLKAESVITKLIHAPLFDKITKLLNTGETNDDFPKIVGSFEKRNNISRFCINGLVYREFERNGIESHVEEKLKDYIIGKIMDEKEIALSKLISEMDFEADSHDEIIFRYNTKQFPYYNPGHTGWFKVDNKRTLIKMVAIQALAAGMSCEEEDIKEIENKVNGLMDAYFALDSEEQYLISTREELASKLNEITGDNEKEKNLIIAEKIGIYVSQTDTYYYNTASYSRWAEEHLYRKGDIILPASNWNDGVFLVTDYSQIKENNDRLKYAINQDNNLYERKIRTYNNEILKEYLEKYAVKFGTEEGTITLPLPYLEEKKNRPQLISWLKANAFMLGFEIKNKDVNVFLKMYSEYRKHNEKKDKGFRNHIFKCFYQMLEEGWIIDASINHGDNERIQIKNNPVLMEIIDKIIEILP